MHPASAGGADLQLAPPSPVAAGPSAPLSPHHPSPPVHQIRSRVPAMSRTAALLQALNREINNALFIFVCVCYVLFV